MRIYIDTSVLAAYYCPEPASLAAERALQTAEPVVSSLCEVELLSVLAQKVRDRSLSRSAATRIGEKFQRHVADGYFVRVPVAPTHFDAVRGQFARFETGLRPFDALHLAVVAANRLSLLTSDPHLHTSALQQGLKSKLIW